MTDKVQKIREWVKSRLGENTSKQSLPQFYGMMEEDARFLDFLDSIQKEPTGNPLGSTHAEFRTAVESLGISQEEYDRIVDECIYGKESELVDVDDLPNKEEESVSEDLGDYINELSKQFPEVSFAKLSRIAVRVAKWQKEQFEKNRLKHCNSITNEQAELEQGFIDQHIDKYNRMPTFLDAIEYGIRLQREHLMKDAIDAEVLENYD